MKKIVWVLLFVACGFGVKYHLNGMGYAQEAAKRRFDQKVQRLKDASQKLQNLKEEKLNPSRPALMIDQDIKAIQSDLQSLSNEIQQDAKRFGFTLDAQTMQIIQAPEKEQIEQKGMQELNVALQKLDALKEYNFDNLFDAIDYYQSELDRLERFESAPQVYMQVRGFTDYDRAASDLEFNISAARDMLERLNQVSALYKEITALGGNPAAIKKTTWTRPEQVGSALEAQASQARREAYQRQRAQTPPMDPEEAEMAAAIAASLQEPQYGGAQRGYESDEDAALAAAIAASLEEQEGRGAAEEEWGLFE